MFLASALALVIGGNKFSTLALLAVAAVVVIAALARRAP
jgi:hypothetical protein